MKYVFSILFLLVLFSCKEKKQAAIQDSDVS